MPGLDEREYELGRWVKTLLRRCGVHVETFNDGSMGLVNVPAKYVAAIDAMHFAMVCLIRGESLPEFEPLKPKKAKAADASVGVKK